MVVASDEQDGEPPVVKEFEEEISVIEGQQAILRVDVTGVPQPTITWQCGDKQVEPDYAIEIARDGALCFVSVEMSHAGEYCFTACNASGTAEGKVRLKVRGEGEEGCMVSGAGKEEDTKTNPVPVDKFGEHVAELHAKNNVGFYREYQVCIYTIFCASSPIACLFQSACSFFTFVCIYMYMCVCVFYCACCIYTEPAFRGRGSHCERLQDAWQPSQEQIQEHCCL